MSATHADAVAFLAFIERIAAFTPGGVNSEDDADTINSIRHRARELLGWPADDTHYSDEDDGGEE